MTRGDRFETLATLEDAIQAEMLRDLLEQEGIPVSTPGAMHRGLLGHIGGFVKISVQVPARDLERAREIMAALSATPVAGEELESGDGEDVPSGLPPRRKRVAAFCALGLTFGTGHFYARDNLSGSALLVGEVAAIWLALQGLQLALLFVPLLVLTDLFGAFVAVDRANGVARSTPLRSSLPLIVPGLLLAVALFRFGAPETFAGGAAGTSLCRWYGECVAGAPDGCRDELLRRAGSLRLDYDALDACAGCLEAQPDCGAARVCRDACEGLPAAWALTERDIFGY